MNGGTTMTAATMGSRYAPGYGAPNGTKAAVYAPAGNGSLLRSVACYVAVGTMGLLTPQALENRNANATALSRVHYEIKGLKGSTAQAIELERSAADNLARIREVLKPTVLELANLFEVSRQAIYDWQKGAQPSPQTAHRLVQLARVADTFAEAGLAVDANTLRRKVAGGGTLLDALASGADAESIAKSLVATLKREAAQRERLQAQLAGRKRAPVNLSDYGAPAVSEDV